MWNCQSGTMSFAGMRRSVRRAGILLIGVTLGLVGCAGAPTQPSSSSAEQISAATASVGTRTRADEARAQGDTDLALRLFVEAADADSSDAESLYQIGAIYEERGDTNRAARAYARAVQVDSAHARALEGLGLRYFADRQLEQARPLLTRAVAADPELWRSHNTLGLIADSLGEHSVAAKHYAVALAIRPGAPGILNNRGYSSYLGGDLAAAERDFRAALTTDPTYERAWQNLGLVYARRGDYTTAVATLSRVASKHVAANDVGYIAMISGDYEQAELLFADAIRLSPRYYDTANKNAAELRRRRAQVASR